MSKKRGNGNKGNGYTYTGEVRGIEIGVLPAIAAAPTESQSPRPAPVPDVFLTVRFKLQDGPTRYQRVATGIGRDDLEAQVSALVKYPTGCTVRYKRIRDREFAVLNIEDTPEAIKKCRAEMVSTALTTASDNLGQ